MSQSITLAKEKKETKEGIVQYWALRWYDVNGKRRSKVVCKDNPVWYDSTGEMLKKKKKELDKEVARIESEITRDLGQYKSGMRLKDFLDKVFELREKELAPSSISRYRDTANYLQHHFGENRKADTITTMDAAGFKNALANGRLANASKTERTVGSTSTVLHIRNAKALFSYGKKTMKVIKENPFSELSCSDKTATKWYYISPADFKSLMNVATLNFKALIALCRLRGLRRMEAYNLEWDDINFDESRLYICAKKHWIPKDRETRDIPMCKELSAILLEAFHAAPEGTIRVCPETNPQNINRAIKGTIKRAGLKLWGKPLHSMRKSCIQDWVQGYPATDVKEWAGHASIDTTLRYYSKSNKENMKKASTDSLWKSTENHTETQKQEAPVENAELQDYAI